MIFPATMDHWNGSLPDVLTMDVSVNGCQVTLPEGRNPKKMRPDLVAPEPPGMKLA